ncbi:MAG: hypothetical protein M0P77_10430, partial [Firmicutes bacterium]|nr:hypothetical protein [Bacillota bacterium]
AFTAFQMAAWGGIGFISGFFQPIMFPKKRRPADMMIMEGVNYNIMIIILWGGLTGAIFSLFMDIQSVLFYFNTFRWDYYLTVIVIAIPITIEYIITNILFILLLYRPVYYIFNRLREKYGIGP